MRDESWRCYSLSPASVDLACGAPRGQPGNSRVASADSGADLPRLTRAGKADDQHAFPPLTFLCRPRAPPRELQTRGKLTAVLLRADRCSPGIQNRRLVNPVRDPRTYDPERLCRVRLSHEPLALQRDSHASHSIPRIEKRRGLPCTPFRLCSTVCARQRATASLRLGTRITSPRSLSKGLPCAAIRPTDFCHLLLASYLHPRSRFPTCLMATCAALQSEEGRFHDA